MEIRGIHLERPAKIQLIKKRHACWNILFACCMIQGAGLGVINNCVGLFYLPISRDLGFPVASITLYVTLQSITTCLVMLCANQIFRRFPLRVIMTAASILTAVPVIAMGCAWQLWHWYLLSILQGIGMAFTTSLAVPIILGRWFHKKIGFALGMSTAFAGLCGAVMSAVLGKVICASSWRMAYILSGGVCFLMAVPVSVFILQMDPAEKHTLPYGYESEPPCKLPQEDPPAIHGRKNEWSMGTIFLLAAVSKAFCAFISHLTAYGSSIQLTIANVSMLTSFCMLGNMSTKLTFGALNDQVGTEKASHLALGVIGTAILLLLTKNQYIVCAGSFFYGMVSMFAITELPLLAKSVWSQTRYSSALIVINVAGYLSQAVCVTIYGYLYDRLGRYDEILWGLFALLLFEALMTHLLIRKNV